MKSLVDWLTQDCNAHDVSPVVVTIGDESWDGARYKQTFTYTADMDGVRDGRHKAGDKYTEEHIYCIGRIPKVYARPPRSGQSIVRKEQNVCFPFEGLDWYVSGYVQNPHNIT